MDILLVVGAGVLFYYVLQSGGGGGSDSIEDIGGVADTSEGSVTVRIAQAIAAAEGFGVEGARPTRNHNPGDMTADLIGRSIDKDGAFVVYANDEDGWANLYAQVNAWLDGTSRHAGPQSTIFDISRFYTTTEQDVWAANVADVLGVDLDTPIGTIA